MKAKYIISCILCGLAVLLAGYYVLNQGSYSIKITVPQIKAKLQEKFPLTKDAKIFAIKLANPKVGILQNKLSLGLEVIIDSMNSDFLGYIDMITEVSYDRTKGQVILINPQITSLTIPGYPGDINIVKAVINKISTAIINGIPVYTIDPTNAKMYAIRHLLDSINIKNNSIIVTLSANK